MKTAYSICQPIRLVVLFIVLIFGTIPAIAQTESSVTLRVIFNPIQNITVNSSQKTVDIEYTTLEDFQQGVENRQADHLSIYSTGSYEITVHATDLFNNIADANKHFAPSNLHIAALLPHSNPTGTFVSSIELDHQGKKIIASTAPAYHLNFDIVYKGVGGHVFLEYALNTENTETYSTDIVYTISTK